MKQVILLFLALTLSVVLGAPVILKPASTSGKHIAVVWVQGAECKSESYVKIA